MESLTALLDFAFIGLVPLMFWVRKLIDKIDGMAHTLKQLELHHTQEHDKLSVSIEKMWDAQSREHKEVGGYIQSIALEHKDHDRQNTRLEVKVDGMVRHVERWIPPTEKI